MIIQLEIDQFIKDIQSKVDKLPEDQKQRGLDKINLLSRIKLEFREYDTNSRKVMNLLLTEEVKCGKMIKEIEVLRKENKDLKKQLITNF